MTDGSNEGLAEQWYAAAQSWKDADAAARLLEETKSALVAQRMAALGDMAVNRAEQTVKASTWYYDHIKKIVDAKTLANEKKIEMEYAEMKRWEHMNDEANHRAGTRL